MTEQHDRQTGELSIDELDSVAGGAANANTQNTSRSNVRNNITEVAPPVTATPMQATPAQAAPSASSF